MMYTVLLKNELLTEIPDDEATGVRGRSLLHLREKLPAVRFAVAGDDPAGRGRDVRVSEGEHYLSRGVDHPLRAVGKPEHAEALDEGKGACVHRLGDPVAVLVVAAVEAVPLEDEYPLRVGDETEARRDLVDIPFFVDQPFLVCQ